MGSGSSRRRGAAAGAAAVPAGRAAESRELLVETALAEGGEAAAELPGPGRRAPTAGGIPPPRDTGTPPEQAVLSARSLPGPENNNADHQCPQRNSKMSSGKSTISYDYSEEELMASIEREYCR